MAIIPIGGAAAALPTLPTQAVSSTPATGGTSGFGDKFAQAMDELQATHAAADQTARLAATGQLSDPSEHLIAATQASLATELTVAVRNKAVEAFNSIMQMGV
jgi:flagellar hook-basal body complex protein FliE